MAQQAPFEKLKEQIEAAKRGLTEISSAEKADDLNNVTLAAPTNNFSSSASLKIVEPETSKASSGDLSRNDSDSTKIAGMTSKTVLNDTPIAGHTFDNAADISPAEFQFFHRAEQPKGIGGMPLGISSEEAGSVDVKAEAFLFEQFGPRLASLEGGAEQNRKYILELIDLLSQLDLRQEPANRKLRPSQLLNRRSVFWLVIGFLVVGWFCLTPSGHLTVQHFLAFK